MSDIAVRQHGVVARRQLLAAGLTRRAIDHRLACGRLHALHIGVYAVGHPALTARGRLMAACLACGPSAIVSHRSAGVLWELLGTNRTRVDITAPDRSRTSSSIVHLHRGRLHGRADLAVIDGIPCTSVARTLVDLAGLLDAAALLAVLERAEILRVFDAGALEAALARVGSRRRGTGTLRRLSTRLSVGPSQTRSALEERFLAMCRRGRLAPPEVDTPVVLPGGRTVVPDFLWREARLIVETDGWATHGTRTAFARDRRRDVELTLAGFRIVRFTWDQVTRDPLSVTGTLRALLSHASASGGSGP